MTKNIEKTNEEAFSYFDEAAKAIEEKDFNTAVKAYTKVIELGFSSSVASAFFNRAGVYAQLAEDEKVIYDFEQCLHYAVCLKEIETGNFLLNSIKLIHQCINEWGLIDLAAEIGEEDEDKYYPPPHTYSVQAAVDCLTWRYELIPMSDMVQVITSDDEISAAYLKWGRRWYFIPKNT